MCYLIAYIPCPPKQ
uniref:Uncharacterized protein n=1 Tax=Arundo donax TaxID=35708 RepID=A0A0A9AQ16_ARUDO